MERTLSDAVTKPVVPGLIVVRVHTCTQEEIQFLLSHNFFLDQRSRKVVRFHRDHFASVCEPLRLDTSILFLG